MASFLAGKVVAVTGGGGGIGRADEEHDGAVVLAGVVIDREVIHSGRAPEFIGIKDEGIAGAGAAPPEPAARRHPPSTAT